MNVVAGWRTRICYMRRSLKYSQSALSEYLRDKSFAQNVSDRALMGVMGSLFERKEWKDVF